MPQQALALCFKHQHRLASPTTGHAGRMLNGYWLISGRAWKPDVEARSNPGSAVHLHGPVVFLDDFTNRREPEPVAIGTRCKERLENPLQRCLVHAATGIRDKYDSEATGADVNTTDAQHLCYLPHFNSNLDDTWPIHCLSRIVADIQDDLLQLCGFRRYDRRFGCLAHRDRDMGRYRCSK